MFPDSLWKEGWIQSFIW